MTEITKERRDAIRAAAIKATPGPWNNAGIGGVNDFGREHQASLSFEWMPNGIDDDGVNKNWTADTAHIANCDPQTILALLDALDAAEAKTGAEPALWVSDAQLAAHVDPDDGGDCLVGGNYLPARVTPGGLFQTPLYSAPPAAEPVVPEGWVLVPREPTEAMIDAGWIKAESDARDFPNIWAAMLAAAPALTTSPEPRHE